jgi:hypothetical protein
MSDYRQDIVLTAEELARVRAMEQLLRAAAAAARSPQESMAAGPRKPSDANHSQAT